MQRKQLINYTTTFYNIYNMKNLSKNEKKLCEELFKIGAVKFGKFKLKIHNTYPEAPTSPIYIDLRLLRRFPKAKKAAINTYIELLKPIKFDLLADIPTAATPFVATISDKLNIGMITPRMDKKKHGSGATVDGMLGEDRGKIAVAIDDLVTGATSKFEATNVLEKSGIVVNDIVVLIDRKQGGKLELEKRGYKLHYALELDTMLSFYQDAKYISEQEHKSIKEGIKQMKMFLTSKRNVKK